MTTIRKNIPALRFKEFSGEWVEKTLGEIAVKRIVKNTLNKYVNVLTNSAAQGIVYQRDFFDKDIANQNNLLGYYIVETDDFIYNPRISNLAPVGPISRNKLEIGVMSPLYSVFRFKEGNLDFFEIFFYTNKWHTYMESIANYGARDDRMSFPSASFFKMPLLLPTFAEQEKIAGFLTVVDEKIELLEEKKRLLEAYKKGVMQKLFSQELRFKDEAGAEYGEWEEKKLGEIFYCEKGKGLSKNKIVENGIYECILYGELYTKYKEVVFNIFSKTNDLDGVKSKTGDLLIPSSTTTTGIDLANVTALNKNDILLGGDITILRSCNNNSNNIFYAYYLSNYKKDEIASYAQGSTIVHLYYSHIKDMIIDLPSFQEQEKIANFLSSIDDKIQLVAKQMEQLREWKKGLLQKMFC
jgi:type I restriction enzyme, S subunit